MNSSAGTFQFIARLIQKRIIFSKNLRTSTTLVTTTIWFFLFDAFFLSICNSEMFLSSPSYSRCTIQELNVYRKPGPHSTLQFHQHKLHYEGRELETNSVSSQRSGVVEQHMCFGYFTSLFLENAEFVKC